MKYPLMRNNIVREDLDAVIEHLRNPDPRLTAGENVKLFEENWSNWLGIKHSVFVNSGASANMATLSVLKTMYPEGGEIIVPPLTWVSDIVAVIFNGFTPVFVDIEMSTLAMNPLLLLSKINQNTKAVFLTHAQGFNGLTSNLLRELESRQVHLIEDVCESHGASFEDKKLGTYGLISNFSFYYAHHLSTIEGGMICTDDDELYSKFCMTRGHGLVREIKNEKTRKKYYDEFPDLNPEFIFDFPAFNIRNTEIGGILGISQLKRLDQNIDKRNENKVFFLQQLDSEKFFTEFNLEGQSNYAFNLILREPNQENVEKLTSKLKNEQIEFRRGSAGGGNQLRQPYLKKYIQNIKLSDFPVVEHIHFYGFYIGNFPSLTKEEITHICNVLNNSF